MEKVKNGLKKNAWGLLLGLCAFFVSIEMDAMEQNSKNLLIFVQTNDGHVVPVERWKIDQMKVLLVLLEHQRGRNSLSNPIDASMLSFDELRLLRDGLEAASRKMFELFFMDIAHNDNLFIEDERGRSLASHVGNGKLRMLVNAAQKVEATGLSALCSSYFLPPDMQKLLIPTMINASVEFLKKRIMHLFVEDRRSHIGDIDKLTCLAFSPDGQKIVAASRDGKIGLWEASTGNLIHKFVNNNPQAIAAVAFSSDGKKMVTARFGKRDQICVWDVETGKLIKKITGLEDWPSAIAFSPVDDNLIVVSYIALGDKVAFWDVSTEKLIRSISGPIIENQVVSVAFSPDGTMLLVGEMHRPSSITLWDVATGNLIQTLVGNFGLIFNGPVRFSSDGMKVLAAGSKNIGIWDIRNRNNPYYRSLPNYGLKGICTADFSGDGSRILVTGGYNYHGRERIRILMFTDSGDILFDTSFPKVDENHFVKVKFSPDDKRVGMIGVSDAMHKSDLSVWQLLTDYEEAILKNMSDLTVAQARLIYQLCLSRLRGLEIRLTQTTVDFELFMTLPDDMQQLLSDCLFVPGCPSDKPGEERMGSECVIL